MSLSHRLTAAAIVEKGLLAELRETRERFNRAESLEDMRREAEHLKELWRQFGEVVETVAKLRKQVEAST